MLLGSKSFSTARNCAGIATLIPAMPVRCFGGSAITPELPRSLKGRYLTGPKIDILGMPVRFFLAKNKPRAPSASPHNNDCSGPHGKALEL